MWLQEDIKDLSFEVSDPSTHIFKKYFSQGSKHLWRP